jgi:hypothetical protein
MFRKSLTALAALSLVATPVLAQSDPKKPESEHIGPVRRDTILPLSIIVGLLLAVIGFTMITRDKKRASP